MKEINLYVRGVSKNVMYEPYRIGIWVAILEYKGRIKKLGKRVMKNANSVEMIITGLIEAIKLLKEPCIINVYTHTLYFQRNKVARKNNDFSFRAVGTYQELLEELDAELKKGNHILNTIISGKYQQELAKEIKKLKT